MKKHQLHEKIEFTNVRQLVEWAAEEYGDKTAYSFKNDPIKGEVIKVSRTQFRDEVRALSSELLSRGYAGRHGVLIAKPSYEWILTYFAVLSIGAVLVPLDRDWMREDLADTAKKADVSFLFCDEDLCETAEFIISETQLQSTPVYLNRTAGDDGLSALIESGRVKYEADPAAYHNAPIDPMKLSLLVFTSGTTGKGKGVMLSQNSILSNVSDAYPYIDFSDKTVSVLPLHHTYGSTVMLLHTQ